MSAGGGVPIGWQITVHRPAVPLMPETWRPSRTDPYGGATLDKTTVLAAWQSRVSGLDWIDTLVAQGRGVVFAGCAGYPFTYIALAADVLPVLADPPAVNDPWVLDEGDVLDPGWGRGCYDGAAVQACDPQEWLLVTVWDES